MKIVKTYINMLFYSVFIKSILQNFIVLNILIIEFGSPLYFDDTESAWINGIHNLAID